MNSTAETSPTFTRLFENRRERLNSAVAAAAAPEKAGRLVEVELEGVLREFISGARLSPRATSVATYLMDFVKLSVDMSVAATCAEVWQRPNSLSGEQRPIDWHGTGLWTVVALIEFLLAGFTLVLLFDSRTKLPFALLATAWVAGLSRRVWPVIVRVFIPLWPTAKTIVPQQTAIGVVKIKPDIMLARVAELLLCAEKAFALATDESRTDYDRPPIDPNLVEFYQDLLEAEQCKDPEYAMKKIRLLPVLLTAQGVQTAIFDGGNAALFEFRTSADPHSTVRKTARPALTKDNQLLRRGIVEDPAEEPLRTD